MLITRIALIAALALVPAVARGETPSAMLEKGVFLQETAGDLDAAVKLYQQIVEQANANRRFVAEAQFRIGECYQKQGKKAEAEAAFQQVVALYPDQAELVAKARKELGETEPGRAPNIVSTSPAAFAEDVSPALDKMTVTFDQKMKDGSWAWVTNDDLGNFPKTGKPCFDAAMMTCTVSCTLEPGKVYWVGINEGRFQGFVSESNVPARTYIILFATQSADGKPTPIPANSLEQAKAINARVQSAAGLSIPAGATRLSYVKDSSTGKRSLGGSGHAVLFERPADKDTVIAVQIFASRYGTPIAPAENFHVYLLNENRTVIGDFQFSYGMIERTEEMRWYNLPIAPPTAVPQKFYVALHFNPTQFKGIYLGQDNTAGTSHSFTGLPTKGFKAAGDKSDWMVRPVLIGGKAGNTAK